MIQDNFALTGALTIAINDAVVQETDNLVVTVGREWVANRLKDTVTGFTQKVEMSHMAIGTSSTDSGTTAAAYARTTLGTELDRNALTTDGGTVSGATIQYACTWAATDGTGAITEAGIFNHATAGSGDMFARTVFAVVNKGAADSMTITWTITVS